MDKPRIIEIGWAPIEGRRPRHAGRNARMGDHGIAVRVPIARVVTDDGRSGFGFSRVERTEAEALVGSPLEEAFVAESGVQPSWLAVEYPLWDLAGMVMGSPVYRLAAACVGADAQRHATPFRVRCYDTSLYFDDLSIEDDDQAAALIAREAREGYDRGHRNFKIKVGRGARHMPLEAGTRRDIAVIRAVRAAVGPEGAVMIDANNGYNLNLAKQVLSGARDCRIHWLEEPFHEDRALYEDLRAWLGAEGLAVLLADGEGQASPLLMEWARDAIVDVVQYDVFRPGFTRWLSIGAQLDGYGVQSAPHHYGGVLGNYTAGHLAGAIRGFAFVEWDEASCPAIDASAYRTTEGWVTLPDRPGFGLALDQEQFQQAVKESGWVVTAPAHA